MNKKLKIFILFAVLTVIAVIGVLLGLFLPRDADGIGIEEYLDSEILSVRVTYRHPDYADMELRDVSEVRILMESLQNATFYRRFPSHRAKTGVLPERLEIQTEKGELLLSKYREYVEIDGKTYDLKEEEQERYMTLLKSIVAEAMEETGFKE